MTITSFTAFPDSCCSWRLLEELDVSSNRLRGLLEDSAPARPQDPLAGVGPSLAPAERSLRAGQHWRASCWTTRAMALPAQFSRLQRLKCSISSSNLLEEFPPLLLLVGLEELYSSRQPAHLGAIPDLGLGRLSPCGWITTGSATCPTPSSTSPAWEEPVLQGEPDRCAARQLWPALPLWACGSIKDNPLIQPPTRSV